MINGVRKRIDGPNRGYNVLVYPLGDDGRWIVGLFLKSASPENRYATRQAGRPRQTRLG
jgi:hypothetical protein